ncbi:MAG: class I SAM-dependent methyltransferase [Planctomycetota bacterium]|nr:MAG: class I SAM-dependent methyltransferase [Planctomycetota bacterium]
MTNLHRILEPEVMDTLEEAFEYDSMDHSQVNEVFCNDFFAARNLTDGAQVLDVGTGTAQIPLAMCRRNSGLKITAIDLAESMLTLGNKNIQTARLQDSITLAQVDSKKMPYPDESFDQVISNSIIHHIPNPIECFKEMIRVTKKDGLLFIRDLLRPFSMAELQNIVNLHAGDATPKQKQLFTDSLHASLSLTEVRKMVKLFGFEAFTVIQSSNRHWTFTARKS